MLERHAKTMSEGKANENESDESFYAMENAKIVHEAEKYYRHMFEGGEITWNIRDTHMCDCLQDLLKHNGPNTKAVIWVNHKPFLGN
jgi:erythromycin esterase-like protein